jgi:hypothetical protein
MKSVGHLSSSCPVKSFKARRDSVGFRMFGMRHKVQILFGWRLFGSRTCFLVILKILLPKLKELIYQWLQSASELYRPSDRRLSAKLMSTLADRGCHVVSVTNPQLTVSRLSRQCGILNISQPYRPPRPVTRITLLVLFTEWRERKLSERRPSKCMTTCLHEIREINHWQIYCKPSLCLKARYM